MSSLAYGATVRRAFSTRWGMLGWAGHDSKVWSELIDEATHRANACEKNLKFASPIHVPKRRCRTTFPSGIRSFCQPYVLVAKRTAEHTIVTVGLLRICRFGRQPAAQGGALSAPLHTSLAQKLPYYRWMKLPIPHSVSEVLRQRSCRQGSRRHTSLSAATENSIPPTVTVRAKQLPVLLVLPINSARFTKACKSRA